MSSTPKLSKNIEDVLSNDEYWRVTIDYDKMYFEDVHLLSPMAHKFNERGFYSDLDEYVDKKEWLNFWLRERNRCLNGYTAPNGIHITGYHYFYLNYCPIDRAVDEERDGEIISKRERTFPAFYDGDWLFFHIVDLARRRNLHLNLLKARRKGYSYKNAAMAVRNYYHIRRSKNFILAGDSKYLDGTDGILNKCWEYMDHIDEHTAFAMPRLLNQQELKQSGFEETLESGKKVKKGYKSLIGGLSLFNNPDAVRGAAGELILWEESGKFKELLDAWEIAMPLVKQGAKTVGQMIAFGTGGTEGADFTSAEALFEKPHVYDCLAFNNIWDDGAYGTTSGFFHPNRLNLDGFIDENGNSDMEGAAAYEQREREKKKQGDSAKAYQQYVAEHAEKPAEAVLVSDVNQFPTQELSEQYNHVKADNLHNLFTPGKLYYHAKDGIKFKPDPDVQIIQNFPHSSKDRIEGGISILEAPYKHQDPATGKFKIPDGLYIVMHDPYDHDQSTDMESLGAAYVMKRTNNFSPTYNDCIVATLVGRPDTQDEYNRQLFMLAEYFNGKIGFENDRGDVISYARRHKKLHMLESEFTMADKKELASTRVNRGYGMHMTKPRIEQGELYIRDWLNTVIGRTEEGHPIKVLHKIYDRALLKELIKYNNKGNFDRVRALMVGMYHMKELYHHKVTPARESLISTDPFFKRMG